MTSKTMKNKGFIDCTRGVSRQQRAIDRSKLKSTSISNQSRHAKRSRKITYGVDGVIERMRDYHKLKAEWAAAEDSRCAKEEEQFYKLPDRSVSESTYTEKMFGFEVSNGDVEDVYSSVVSIALFDGDKMLFACSGIPLRRGDTLMQLTRFVTSARLVDEFIANRNKDDNLRIALFLPDKKIIDGFLGLYDRDIAIVTSIGIQDVSPVHLDGQRIVVDPNTTIIASGRTFKTGCLRAVCGSLSQQYPNTFVPYGILTEGALGGPLIQAQRFIGIIHDVHDDKNEQRASFLSEESLYKRLEHFQILNPKELHFRDYSLPKDVLCIHPSGFMKTIRRLRANGYPLPPPLVLEFNGRLLNQFEDYFGQLRAYHGYPLGREKYRCGVPRGDIWENVWYRLKKKVVSNISRRVVSLASFKGDERSFACTGYLIKWHGSPKRTVILTSASLVRNRDNEDDIGNDLRIDVFLPPKQRGCGKLEIYDLNLNIAVISLQEENFKPIFPRIRPDDIFNKLQKSPENVIAIGRDVEAGLLMASSGMMEPDIDSKLDCKDLKVSNCKIKKAGIGGPLITYGGNFVGMNFYNGDKITPFLPLSVIQKALTEAIDLPLPSERALNERNPDHINDDVGNTMKKSFTPEHINDDGGNTMKNRWPVPKPYWYHGALDVHRFHIPMLPGRVLQ